MHVVSFTRLRLLVCPHVTASAGSRRGGSGWPRPPRAGSSQSGANVREQERAALTDGGLTWKTCPLFRVQQSADDRYYFITQRQKRGRWWDTHGHTHAHAHFSYQFESLISCWVISCWVLFTFISEFTHIYLWKVCFCTAFFFFKITLPDMTFSFSFNQLIPSIEGYVLSSFFGVKCKSTYTYLS